MQLILTHAVRTRSSANAASSIIPAIKAVRSVTGLGLREAKDVVDSLCAGSVQYITALEPSNGVNPVAKLAEGGVVAQPTSTRHVLRAALERMPLHLTVAEVLSVLDAAGA